MSKFVKLRVPSCTARPGPAIGQALGPLGVNMAEFCKQFNEVTSATYQPDIPLTVLLEAKPDRTFTFNVRTPATSYLILRAVGMNKGPTAPDPMKPCAYISPEAVYEIAKIKHQDDFRWHLPLEGVARSVVGQARTMGIICREVEEGEEADDDDDDKGATKERA